MRKHSEVKGGNVAWRQVSWNSGRGQCRALTYVGQPGRGSRRRAVGVQEEGSPGSWRWGCRAALAHTRAPHTATSSGAWGVAGKREMAQGEALGGQGRPCSRATRIPGCPPLLISAAGFQEPDVCSPDVMAVDPSRVHLTCPLLQLACLQATLPPSYTSECFLTPILKFDVLCMSKSMY